MDRSLVRDLSETADDGTIAAAIISVARALKVGVIAEGVESFAQLRSSSLTALARSASSD